jgi:hypothetical protein
MKQIIIIVTLLVISVNGIAQTDSSSNVNHILKNYLKIKNFLFTDNGDSAQQASRALYNSIAEFRADSLSPNERKIWKQYSEKISYDALHIKGTNDITHQREHFVTLSSNMYRILQAFDMESDVYYQYCPMANGGKGAYWLNESSEIKNPYMGSKMPDCGSVKDSLMIKQ